VNWQTGNEHFSIKFVSKYCEHVHTQFYYMDQFILQPEENRISLYSCKLHEINGCVKLKAGSFPLHGQWITAVAAPNQLYSSKFFHNRIKYCEFFVHVQLSIVLVSQT